MFEVVNRRNKSRSVIQMLELVFNWTVREVSSGHKNAASRIISQALQLLVMVIAFRMMMTVFGFTRSSPIQGDGLLFLTTGIMLFILFNGTVMTVSATESPDHPLMQHAPMTTFVAMSARALSILYVQILVSGIVFLGYYLFRGELMVYSPLNALKYFIYCWWAGVCTGAFLRSMAIFAPKPAQVIKMAYMRANMIFSGKMTPANYLTASALPMFYWNPLFHLIDRFRGAIFRDYTPYKTDAGYAIKFSLVLLVLGLLGDFYGRQRMRGRQHG